jgi:transcriptional regulator with XRE-family HTH domain
MYVIDGDKVRLLRETKKPKKLTQQDVVMATGLQVSVLSKIENGKKKVINSDALARLAKALDAEPGELLKEVAEN